MEEKSCLLEECKFEEIPKDLLSRGNLITENDGFGSHLGTNYLCIRHYQCYRRSQEVR